mgnify:CR=1 FL=1|tara:strand:+ start:12000 stop:12872 length:873 start_codon:yes stop_codon:yes gene_type:complete
MEAGKALNIARGVIGILAAIFALLTFIVFGANMDAANFPGSTIKLATYSAVENPDKEGQLKQLLGGYEIETTTNVGCTSFVESSDTAADASALNFANVPAENQYVCMDVSDNAVSNRNSDWTDGWIVAPNCARTSDEDECAPFGSSSPVAWFGFLTFSMLSIQVVLYGAHTCHALVSEAIGQTTLTRKNALSTLKSMDSNVKLWMGLTIAWLIIGFSLMITSAFAWDSLCDKIDTGLGRRVEDSASQLKRACATSTCTTSFGSFFATMTIAIVWYRMPDIAQWFGFLEAA